MKRTPGLKIFLLLSAFCIQLFALAGCGYTTRSVISGEYKSIYITPFVNKVDITNELYTGNKYRIYRPLLEVDITRAVVNRYLLDSNLKPVTEDKADLVLKGELTEFRREPMSYDENDEVTQYRVNMVVNLTMWSRKEDKLLWEEKGFNGEFIYYPTSSTLPNVTKTSETQAINDSITDLARRVVERTVNAW